MNQDNENLEFQPDIAAEEGDAEVELVKSDSAVREKAARAQAEEAELEEGEGQLTVDVYQSPSEIIIESPIAGVNPEDLDVAITNESVTIKGKRVRAKAVKEEDYFYQECYWGRFSRSIILPQEIDAEEAEATIKNGVLIIRLPKLNRERSKKLKVRFE